MVGFVSLKTPRSWFPTSVYAKSQREQKINPASKEFCFSELSSKIEEPETAAASEAISLRADGESDLLLSHVRFISKDSLGVQTALRQI